MPSYPRCAGTGMQLISTTYEVRAITDEDRARHELAIQRAEARGDSDDVAAEKHVFAEWVAEQGQRKERLLCPVCLTPWLVPTSKGTARPHRAAADGPSWDKVRLLRKTIAEMQAELNRMLDVLEPD